jgi:Raf kinase inhibitor-like YbhB/YbcL family protein
MEGNKSMDINVSAKANMALFCLILSLLTLLPACARNNNQAESKGKKTTVTIQVISSGFKEGEPIPAKYTCDGENVSPPVKWSNLPDNTKSLALICDDPDAPGGTWVHWVVYNIPPTVGELPEGIVSTKEILKGARQGFNDFKRIGYGGPCPPSGRHRYFFQLYALDKDLGLASGKTKKDLLEAMEGHILAMGHLMGTYQRMR